MKSYHHGNLKQELIDCACRLCERDGYTKLSIRTLAKESGVSQTAPYRHFETKEALYASVAQDGFNKLSKAIHVNVDKKVTKKQIVDMLFLDEIQFMNTVETLENVEKILNNGIDVVCSGLDQDSRGRPWETSSMLLGLRSLHGQ